MFKEKNNKMTQKTKKALIGAGAIVLTALISNIFSLFGKKETTPKSTSITNSINQDSGSIKLSKSQNQYTNDIKGDNNIIVNGDKTETISIPNETKK